MKGAAAVFLLFALSGAVAVIANSATHATGVQRRARAAVPDPPPVLSRVTRAQCPTALVPPAGRSLSQIATVLPTLVRRQLGYQMNPNGTSYRDWYVTGATSLAPVYIATPGAAHGRLVVAHHCGIQTAERSWLVTLVFPQMHVINSGGYFFLA